MIRVQTRISDEKSIELGPWCANLVYFSCVKRPAGGWHFRREGRQVSPLAVGSAISLRSGYVVEETILAILTSLRLKPTDHSGSGRQRLPHEARLFGIFILMRPLYEPTIQTRIYVLASFFMGNT